MRPRLPSTGVLDLRTYKLIPHGAEEFDRIFRERALPMLQSYGIQVVGYGASLEDHDLYYLMRAFGSSAVREEQLSAFYGSDEWRDKHRDSVLALVESYHTVVVELAAATAEALNATTSREREEAVEDTQVLTALNLQFIEAFRQGSWELLEPILSPSFSYLDGATGEVWAHERYVDDLREHPAPALAIDQVAVHVDGNAAIVSARTSTQPGQYNRYVDTYERRDGGWICIHACVWPLQTND